VNKVSHRLSNQHQPTQEVAKPDSCKKPFGFVPLPESFKTAPPVWHDGSGARGRLSGEIRLELQTLTPLLVGWERRRIDETDEPWPIPFEPVSASSDWIDVTIGEQRLRTVRSKTVICPLRAPWGRRPVLLPGDSIKGLLRHEIGALLGAPMERVAERSYSYRPNSLFPKNRPNRRLVPRLARVPEGQVETVELEGGVRVRVPVKLELLPEELNYSKNKNQHLPSNAYRFDPDKGGAPYRGGMGAGEKLNSKGQLHHRLEANPDETVETIDVPEKARRGYLNTLRHLTDIRHGHFSERHPDVSKTITGDQARRRILEAATGVVFEPGDLIWVEWDTENQQIVSLGWHYYYRWAYVDTVRKKGWTLERRGLFPVDKEETTDDDGGPVGLSVVRRLFGYTGDNEGSKGIGRGDHEQLMGRLSVNAAIEVVEGDDTDETRFLPPAFLKELGMPRPSAVEHYLVQPHHPDKRPSDQATLVTYGDAEGYDEPGKLAGRKFYLDRKDAYTKEPWKDDLETNRKNDRSTLALDASRPGRRFRFTVRFRDLDPDELAAMLLALCPHQFRKEIGVDHPDGYCSKLGYARPLGWGTVRIEAKELHWLRHNVTHATLIPEPMIREWFRLNFQSERAPMLQPWLDVHRHKNPDAADYPRKNGKIFTYHASLRASHTRLRRYDK